MKAKVADTQWSNRRHRLGKWRRGRRAGAVAVSTALALTATLVPTDGALAAGDHGALPAVTHKITGTLQFSWWGDTARDSLTYDVIKLFEKAYPGVSVSPEPTANYDNYWQELTVEAAAHDVPCVVTTQTTYLASYEKPTILLPLNSLVKSGAINISDVSKSVIAGGSNNGTIYMIGTGAASDALVYNATMAHKYGIPPLTNNMDWAQFRSWLESAAKKLPSGVNAVDLTTEYDSLVFLYSWVRDNNYSFYVKSGKGYKLGFPEKSLENYWKFWQGLIKSGATNTPAEAAEEPTTSGDDYLAQGKVLAASDTANLLADQTTLDSNGLGTVDDFLSPGSPGAKGPFAATHGVGIDVSGMSIGADCKYVPAAAAFVNFWTNNPAATKVYDSNNGAVTNSADLAAQLSLPSNPEPIRTSLAFFEKLFKDNAPINFDPTGYSTVVTDFETATQAVQFGRAKIPAEAALFFKEADAAIGAGRTGK